MLSHALYRLGRAAARRPWAVIGAWVVVAVFVVGASGAFGRDLQDTFAAPGVDSRAATELMARAGSDRAGLTAQVVLTPRDERATFFTSAGARAGVTEVQAGLADLPAALGATDAAGALAGGPGAAAASGAVSPDGRVVLIRVQYPPLEELDPTALADLEEVAARAGPELRIEMGGDLFFAFEEGGTGLGEVLGLVAAAGILLVAFGSLIAMVLPIGTAVLGLALGISSLSLLAHVVDVPAWAPGIGSMVGLGVGIDYALFLVVRHREQLARGAPVAEAAGRAVATAGRAVVFAGGTVVLALLGLVAAGIPFLTAGGVAISVIVLVVVAASVTLVPAFLGLAGTRIDRLAVRRSLTPATAGWRRRVAHVSRHPWPYLVAGTVLLLALTAPMLGLRLGNPDDGSLPESRTERRAYDLVAEGFGPGVNGPLVVAVDAAADPGAVVRVRDAVRADRGIASVAPPETAAGVATLVAYPTTGPQDGATVATVARLRAEVLPAALGGSPARAHVGGQTATFADLGGRVADRLPLFVGAVLLLSFLLLTVVFRSVLVPAKAALLNLLSIGAAYGVLVMVFQWGWGADLVGLESTVPIVSFIPLFMFAILFGLSMDYEVFLLSRVREEYDRTGDTDTAVVEGIARTARVITSAALIMISVFLGFVLSTDPRVKMFGLGLATAILIDATVVRMVLVPAVMTLLGPANWWLPAWLDRLLPTAGQPAAQDDEASPSEDEPAGQGWSRLSESNR